MKLQMDTIIVVFLIIQFVFIVIYVYLQKYRSGGILVNKTKYGPTSYPLKKRKEEKTLLSYSLTQRELEVAQLILEKKPYRQIGEEMYIAPKTVSKHASNIFKKTGHKNRKEFTEAFGPYHKVYHEQAMRA